MTKLKNTKKGMAKKALSISLVAAMLATSNVPVWAAEFSDGTEAVVVEEAGDVNVFSSEADVPAPVAEEAVDEAAVVAADSSVSNPKTTLKVHENGWANNITSTGEVYTKDGTVLTRIYYEWVVGGEVRTGNTGTTNRFTAINPLKVESTDIGKEVVLRIYESSNTVIGNDSFVYETAPVTVSKAKIDNSISNQYLALDLNGQNVNHTLVYNGKTQIATKDGIANTPGTTIAAWANFDNVDANLSKDNFDITCEYKKHVGDGIDAGNVLVITATPKDKDLYTGSLNYDYTIVEKDYAAGDISATYVTTPKTYEYTGKLITPDVSELKLYDNVGSRNKELNAESIVKKVTTYIDPAKGNRVATTCLVGDSYVARVNVEGVPNFTSQSLLVDEWIGATKGFTVVKRDLSNVEIKVDTIAFTGAVLEDNDPRFSGKIHFFDKTTGEELNLVQETDYQIHVLGKPSAGTKDYTVEIKAPEGANNTTSYQQLSFQLGNMSFDKAGYTLTQTSKNYLQEAVSYIGKDVTKDASKVVFTKADGSKLSPENYEVTVYGKDAGSRAGKVVIKGLKSFADCEEVYYFNIDAAIVTNVKATPKVIYNKGYKEAKEYAPAVTVTAKSTDGTVTFTLDPESYSVEYRFASTNMIGQDILSKVTITDKNFRGGKTVWDDNATRISKRSLASSTVTATAEPGSYTYTGAVVKPTLKIMDGNEPLYEGVDYDIVGYKEAKDVGTATVTIKGHGTNANPADGIYDTEETRDITYEITPANAEDIEVEFATGNTGVTYTGNALKPTIIKVTLNGNDVSKQFDFVYPETNVNVGTGHVILKPVTGNKNFTGQKDAEFQIVPAELRGTLRVFDEKGKQYTVRNGVLYDGLTPVYFAYDGEAHTFAKAQFIPTDKNVTANDYEIVYIDNVYGKVAGADWIDEDGNGYAYIAVIGKNNYAGKDEIHNASGDIVKVVTGTAYKFGIKKYDILKQHVTIADGEYACGQPVRPNVTVVVGGKTLVENRDYKLIYGAISDLTNGKTMNVSVEGINGYKGTVTGTWGVVKKDFANTQVVMSPGTHPNVAVYNSGVVVPASEYTVSYEEDGVVVTANANSKYYTGSVKAKYVGVTEDSNPATPIITDVVVVGNKATVKLAGACDGATGYDFVISDANNVTDARIAVNKNQLGTNTTFNYVGQGLHYAYLHAWKRGEDGKKVFSEWSNVYPFVVSSITPEQPGITGIKVSGSTVTVTYTKCANATGYDLILGTALKKVSGETRPVEYGTLVRKVTNGNTVTATFKNVPAGTYYAGLHAYNRTSEDGKKVFSRWSNSKKITVK